MIWRWIIWLVYVAVWTWALLLPHPELWARALLLGNEPDSGGQDPVGQQLLSFLDSAWFSKGLHISAYAVLAVLSAWVGKGRIRWLLLAFMSLHALGTEFLQSFIPSRHPSWDDVGFDHIGIGLGIILSWNWWVSRFPPKPEQ
jgi:hypothetical protein